MDAVKHSLSGPSSSQVLDAATGLLSPWFRAIARSLQTGVLLVDRGGEVLFANDAVGELLGLHTPAGSEEGLERMAEIVSSHLPKRRAGESASFEVELDPPTGRRRILMRALSIEGAEGACIVLVDDRTPLAALEATLVLASRMPSASVMRSQVHDIKAPLNAMALHLELLRRSLHGEAEKQDEVRHEQLASIEDLQREVARLGSCFDSILDQTLQQGGAEGAPRLHDVRRSVREVVRTLRHDAESRGVRLGTELPETRAMIRASGRLVEQALLHLMLEPLRAQPEGGEVRLWVRASEGTVRVFLEDDVPVGREPALEGPAERKATRTEEHLGVARTLVEAQGGRLYVTQRPGGGTTVEIRFAQVGN